MLASETEAISNFFKEIMVQKFGAAEIEKHFADTHDTLCYATNENQDATLGLLNTDADLAIVIGGYNSSNTSHLVELLEKRFPTYYISSAKEIENENTIHHFDYHNKKTVTTTDFLPKKPELKIIITSGASCPDSLLDEVITKLNSYLNTTIDANDVLKNIKIFSN